MAIRNKKPNAELHVTGMKSVRLLRALIDQAGMTQAQVAEKIGVDPRTMRRYLSETTASRIDAPYVVQFAIECLSFS